MLAEYLPGEVLSLVRSHKEEASRQIKWVVLLYISILALERLRIPSMKWLMSPGEGKSGALC